MKENNKEVSHEFSKGNFPFCYEYFADNIEWKIVGNKTLKGKENVVVYCNEMMAETAACTFNNTNVITENNSIVIEGNCQFTDADNKPGEVTYCDVFLFENDKVSNITSYCI